eukprot:362925-Chlamydomonas_euryale.AAC.2
MRLSRMQGGPTQLSASRVVPTSLGVAMGAVSIAYGVPLYLSTTSVPQCAVVCHTSTVHTKVHKGN